MIRSSVVLPDPLAPISPTVSPSCRLSEAASSTRRPENMIADFIERYKRHSGSLEAQNGKRASVHMS